MTPELDDRTIPTQQAHRTFRAFVWLTDELRADPTFNFDEFAGRAFRDSVESHGGSGGSVSFSRELSTGDLDALGWQEQPGARCYMLEGPARKGDNA